MQMLEIHQPAQLHESLAHLSLIRTSPFIGLSRTAANEAPVLTVPPGEGDIVLPSGLFDRIGDLADLADRSDETDMSPESDRCGMEEVFRGLVKDYGASLYYFVLKRVGHPDDAADIAQQAFVEAACSLTAYRGEAKLSTWIFGIATNLSRNHVNRAPQYRHRFESDEGLEERESPALLPCERASQREGLELVTEAMSRLPREMSEALHLVAVDELSYEEAAAELNVPVGTVRSRVSRARAAVRKHLTDAGYGSVEA